MALSNDEDFLEEPAKKKAAGDTAGKKRLSVERIYQKKSQLEHILLRPDTYIGSVEPLTQTMWVYDQDVGMVNREITFVPGLYKIFDEILVNAADNKQRDKKMDCIKIEIDPDKNKISIWNNGEGIPVVEHKDEKMYVPTLIFGHLLTSSNYNDEEQKVTGGRNGYGAKLCNIFSLKFIVETASKQSKKNFKQTWTSNMGQTTEPKVFPYSGEEYTSITFYPDLAKFKMTTLDKDIVALMSRRAYDVAGTSRGVKVLLNGKRLPVKGFKDYIDQYLKGKDDESGNPLKVVYESASERWEVGLTLSIDKGFQQVSFVNSIATTKGGRHVDYVADQIVSKVIEAVKKKNKGGIQVRPFQIKNHIWLFLNCLIVNPTFDSQTKENMTLQMKSFGSKCTLTDKFFTQVLKSGVVESVLNWVKFKTETQMNKKCSATKHSKLRGIPKLEDANDAGTKNSVDCTLILTEGDSAKTLAVSGLGVVGRDKYGVFPLRGKMLNVREATQKQILENAEINNIIKIVGLQYKKKYETMDDLKKLRYGRLMIMADQDQDGSHIKGLLINFIHHNWPSLLKLPFLEEFITPIVKATRGNEELKFYSLPEFEEWKTNTQNWSRYKIKYYKGLGTSTAKEAKEYFQDMLRHRIKFQYTGAQDDESIQLAFSKKMIEQRKEWLTNGMEDRKHRRELGLPELYLYGKNTVRVTYSDFVNKELILFSNTDNERSIPSLVDGLKPGQRKVLFTCIKRNDKREVKVAQLAGSVAEHSAYHHGEQSLMATIINLAQNFVGSNNINLLMPIGQFGTRLQGGKDSASPRYIFTKLSSLARHIISPLDEPLLHHLKDDNQKIEPEYYIPIIPMVLVNGADGIGTGWSTRIPNYNPREIVENLLRMLRGDEPVTMKPWFKNFLGTIEQLDNQHFAVNGECSILGPNKFEIIELPVRTWTSSYKETVLEAMLHGSDKAPSLITDYKDYTTDITVRFVVQMSEDNLAKSEEKGLHKLMKLQSSISTTTMVLFDANGVLRKYNTPEDIIKEFFTLRLSFYVKRKAYLQGMLQAEACKLTNQARFIVEKIEGKIILEDKKKASVVKVLQERGYDSDPVRLWKEAQMKDIIEEASQEEDSSDAETESQSSQNGTTESGPDYTYLFQMSLLSLTREMKEELLKKKGDKLTELKNLESQSPEDLWKTDLKNFLAELDIVEEKEREDDQGFKAGKKKQVVVGGAGKGRVVKKGMSLEDTKPSPTGQRVEPIIDPEMKKRFEKITSDSKRKGKPVKKEKVDEDEDIPTLADRLGNSPHQIESEKAPKKRMKQSTINFKAAAKRDSPKKGKGGKKKNPWSGSDSENESGLSDMDARLEGADQTVARGLGVPPPTRRAAANAKKYTFNSDDSDEDEDAVATRNVAPKRTAALDITSDGDDDGAVIDDDEEDIHEDKKQNGDTMNISSDSDSSSESKKLSAQKRPSDNSDALFNSLLGNSGDQSSSPEKATADPAPVAPARKPISISDSDSDSNSGLPPALSKLSNPPKAAPKRRKNSSDDSSIEDFQPKKKTTLAAKRKPAPKAGAKKTEGKGPAKPRKKPAAKKGSDSESNASDIEFDISEEDEPVKSRPAASRAKPQVKYNFDEESSDEDF